jgi:hypothetical protein
VVSSGSSILKDVVIFSSNPNPSSKTFSFTIGDANYLPSTGHYYVFVDDLNITGQMPEIKQKL